MSLGNVKRGTCSYDLILLTAPRENQACLEITMETWLAANFSNPPASVSQVLGLQVHTTMSRLFSSLQGFDSPSLSEIHYVAQAGLILTVILQPQPPNCTIIIYGLCYILFICLLAYLFV